MNVDDRVADVSGVRLHYLVAGTGDPVILFYGYAETSHMWRPLIGELAKTHTVVAPDLRGFDQSSKPDSGYDKKTMAQDVHALAVSLGFNRAKVVGHDIGLMVAYAYAAQYPTEVDRLGPDGCVPSWCWQRGERLALARPVALSLLRRGAAQASGRP